MKRFRSTEVEKHFFLSAKATGLARLNDEPVEMDDDFVHEYERIYAMAKAFESCVINHKFTMEAYLKALSKGMEAHNK